MDFLISKHNISTLILYCYLLILTFSQCKNNDISENHSDGSSPCLTCNAIKNKQLGNLDSSIYYFNKAFDYFKSEQKLDSIIFYAESYMVVVERTQTMSKAHQFMYDLENELLQLKHLDSLLYSKFLLSKSILLFNENKPVEAIKLCKNSLAIRQRHTVYPSIEIADAYDYLSVAFGNNNELKNGLEASLKSAACYKALTANARSNLPWILSNISNFYFDLGIFDLAEQYSDEAADSIWAYKQITNSSNIELSFMIQKSSFQRIKGNFTNAILNANQILKYTENSKEIFYKELAYDEIIQCYKEMHIPDSMLVYAKRNYNLLKEIHHNEMHQNIIQSLIILSTAYLEKMMPDSALLFTKQAENDFIGLNNLDSSLFTEIQILRAKCMIQKKNLIESQKILEDVIEKNHAKLTNDQLAGIYTILADSYPDTSYAKISFLRKSLALFNKTRNSNNPERLSVVCQLAEVYLLQHKMNDLIEILEKNKNLPGLSLENVRLLALRTHLNHQFRSENTKIKFDPLKCYYLFDSSYNELIKSVSGYLAVGNYGDYNMAFILKNASLKALDLYQASSDSKYLEDALHFSERFRLVPVRLQLQSQLIKQFGNMPSTLVQLEKETKNQIDFFELMISKKDSSSFYHSFIASWKAKQKLAQNTYDSILQIYKSQFPNYFNVKFNNPISTIKDIQHSLNSQQALLNYFQNDSNFICIVISKNSTKSFEFHSVSKIADKIKYAVDFLPLNYLDSLGVDDLIVLPDALLFKLPFESLLTDKNGTSSQKFLVEKFKVHYIQSVSQENFYQQEFPKNNKKLLLLAPGFSDDLKTTLGQYSDLEWSKYIQQPFIIKLFGVLSKKWKSITGTQELATKNFLFANLEKANILILGTHAVADHKNPMLSKLILSPTKSSSPYLYAYQLYNLKIPAQLSILSACETGLGEFKLGEGLQSISNAFYFAGCKNVMMTLWKVDEQSTSELLELFLNNLSQGMATDQALQQAKISFINRNPKKSEPFYWAGLVLLGSAGKVELEKCQSNSLVFLIPIILLPLLFYFNRIKRYLIDRSQ